MELNFEAYKDLAKHCVVLRLDVVLPLDDVALYPSFTLENVLAYMRSHRNDAAKVHALGDFVGQLSGRPDHVEPQAAPGAETRRALDLGELDDLPAR